MVTVGIVGHRFFKHANAGQFVLNQCLELLQQIKSENTHVTALSALAKGADTIFAEAAISLHIPLNVVTPFSNYETDFIGIDRKRYKHLKHKATKEYSQSHIDRTPQAYFDAMQIIITSSTLVIAAWDGSFVGGRGGTADAVKVLLKNKQDWIHLDVTKRNVFFHLNR